MKSVASRCSVTSTALTGMPAAINQSVNVNSTESVLEVDAVTVILRVAGVTPGPEPVRKRDGTISRPVPVPVTEREMVSPLAVTLTVVFAVADAVGVKRNVTAWVAPAPTRVNGLPDTMLKGTEVDALPETVPPRVFCTVKTWFAKLPMFTFPKLTMRVGLTENSTRATALAPIEQGLSLPLAFTAVTKT